MGILKNIVITSCSIVSAMSFMYNTIAYAQNITEVKKSVSITDAAIAASNNAPATPLTPDEAQEHNIPCPSFWTVQPNPSVENSLSYVHDSGQIAISVTYIANLSGDKVSPRTFARVSSEQMNCTLPVKSNLLNNAWAFNCANDIEALVYGEPGDLVLLSISGRNDETENELDNFITFLEYQSHRR